MSRRHACDVCGHSRKRWQRLCEFCWRKLPGDIRTAITANWRTGDRRAWRVAKRRAIDFLGEAVAQHMAQHRQRTAAMLGERDA